MSAIKNIAVSLHESGTSLFAAKYAIYLAKQLGAKLYGVYVMDVKPLHDLLMARIFVPTEAIIHERDLEEQGMNLLKRVKKLAEAKNVAYESIFLKGIIHEEIVNKAKELNVDLLVIEDLKEVFSRREIFYDEGERIFRESCCPVVIVKNSECVEKLYKELEQ